MKNFKDYKIATLGSHSALQILKGAKDEGFETVCICKKGSERPYQSYGVADKIILVENYKDYFKIEQELIDQNCIIVPHGSFVAYIGVDRMTEVKAMHYGTKGILE